MSSTITTRKHHFFPTKSFPQISYNSIFATSFLPFSDKMEKQKKPKTYGRRNSFNVCLLCMQISRLFLNLW
ncbi:hypothetical protein HanIR_Chr08g0355301 [Helianthus annuus]|nr:hypothetical protein HanIR_Chr08g0355301 [Helianthus annuus]